MKLLGLLLAYAAAYVVAALGLLRLLTGQWPDRLVPGSRADWFEADLEQKRRSLFERLRALVARDVRPPRPVELFAYERTMLGVSD
jgi:hypothetical protein